MNPAPPPAPGVPKEAVPPAPLFARLRPRLVALVLMALLPALGLVFYNAIGQRHAAVNEAQLEALRLARTAAASQKQHLEAARQLLLTLAQLREVRAGQWSSCEPLFASLLAQHRAYANIGVIAPDGDVVASGVPLTQRVNLGDRSYFLRAKNSTKFALGEYQIGRITGKPSVNLAYPIRKESGELLAVLYVALDLTWLNQLIARADLPEGSTLGLIDRNGTVLLRYPDSTRQYAGQSLTNNRAIRHLLKKNVESTGQASGLDGVARLYGYTPLSRSEGVAESWVVIGIPARP